MAKTSRRGIILADNDGRGATGLQSIERTVFSKDIDGLDNTHPAAAMWRIQEACIESKPGVKEWKIYSCLYPLW
jgi:hypothetical protein